jgi:hypothetical protein
MTFKRHNIFHQPEKIHCMGRNFYYSPLAIFFCLIAIDIASGEPEMVKTNKNASANTTSASLETPYMAPDKIGEETDIWVSFIFNNNEGSMTEIHRSLSEGSGYTLIATIPAAQYEYLDQDLKPRTDYFYKLRAVKDGQFSEFSESYRFKTFSKNYNPDLSARAIDENTIELTFTDNSYNDHNYLVYDEYPEREPEIITMPDSGRTETFTHEASPGTTYNYTVIMWTEDEQEHRDVARATVTTPGAACTASGSILREYWNGVQGSSVSQIPVNSPPTGTEQLTILEGPTNNGIHYGARIRGYICAPVSGYYKFWIASNDNSELWLSTDNNPANKVRIASVSGSTNPRQWTKYATQESVPIHLFQGNKYYIEVLHKQGVGSDNVAVGWRLPDFTLERPIPGNRLSPFGSGNSTGPVVNIINPADGEEFEAPEAIDIEASATDDGTITKVEFFAGSEKLGEDLTAPYSFAWSADEGMYSLTAKATDNDGNTTTSAPVNVNVFSKCVASGTITREYWAGVQGSTVSEIPVERTPTSTTELTIFEGPSNAGIHYGSRISGYICPPMTGPYHFYIASNDHSELWLSTDQDPANKQRIAYVTGATGIRQWNKYASQQSAAIMLTIGQTYYIEALHKQGVGSDNIAVGWRLPDGTMERPIPGNRLSPFEQQQSMMSIADNNQASKYSTLAIYPNPTQRGEQLKISGFAEITENVETAVEIMNMTGDVIYSERIMCGGNCPDYPVNINRELPPGVYVVNLTTNGWRNTKRLLVK